VYLNSYSKILIDFPFSPSIMYKREVTILTPEGLHVRSSALFVKKAKEFISDISVTSGKGTASGKSLFRMQALNLRQGTKITISATGEDEQEAVESLVALIESL
jgi:phosphocarrier protein HPr